MYNVAGATAATWQAALRNIVYRNAGTGGGATLGAWAVCWERRPSWHCHEPTITLRNGLTTALMRFMLVSPAGTRYITISVGQTAPVECRSNYALTTVK